MHGASSTQYHACDWTRGARWVMEPSPRRRMSCWCQRDIISLPGQARARQADHAVVSAACTWKRWVARGGRETGTVGAGMVGLKLCRPFLLIAHCTHSLLLVAYYGVLVYNPNFNTSFSFNIIVALRLCTSTTTTPISQPFSDLQHVWLSLYDRGL